MPSSTDPSCLIRGKKNEKMMVDKRLKRFTYLLEQVRGEDSNPLNYFFSVEQPHCHISPFLFIYYSPSLFIPYLYYAHISHLPPHRR